MSDLTNWQHTTDFDATIGLGYCDNDEELYQDVLMIYKERLSTIYPALCASLETKQFDVAQHLAHSLKSMTSTIGAAKLYELLNYIEQQLRAYKFLDTAPILEKLNSAHRQLWDILHKEDHLPITP